MSDLISRKAIIKAIEELPNCYNGWSDAYDKAYIITTIEEVPTTETEICDECVYVKGSQWCDKCDGKPKHRAKEE